MSFHEVGRALDLTAPSDLTGPTCRPMHMTCAVSLFDLTSTVGTPGRTFQISGHFTA